MTGDLFVLLIHIFKSVHHCLVPAGHQYSLHAAMDMWTPSGLHAKGSELGPKTRVKISTSSCLNIGRVQLQFLVQEVDGRRDLGGREEGEEIREQYQV